MSEYAEQALVTLRTRVDAHFDATLARSPDQMRCRVGCDRCCHARFTVFAIEATRIEAAVAALDAALRERVAYQADAREHQAHCPMLVAGRCAIYEERPIICRTHGVPVAHEHGVDVCELNFESAEPPAASILDLQAVNAPLSVMARMRDGEGKRVSLTDLARGQEPSTKTT